MIIDAHAHVTGPTELYSYFRALTGGSGPIRLTPPHISDEQIEESLRLHLAEVGGVGTDLQLVSPRPWAIPTGDRREGTVLQITQAVNDMVARVVKLHPDRFVGVAALPQPAGVGTKFCLEELERCVTELGFVGCKINPDPGEGAAGTPHMGDEYWYPLYEKMVELDVPALVHGGPFRFSREPELGYFVGEEAIAAWGILRTPQVFKDFPTLKIIIGHGGGYIPYQVGRGRAFRENLRKNDPDLESFDDSMRRLYYDTVLYDQASLELLVRAVGVGRCLFGSDKPANGSVTDPTTGRALNDIKPMIDAISWLSEDDRHAIYEGNARTVYSRLRVPATA
jgi:predicted TIM-barrel fold metal-dependent hydrolase